MGYFAGGGSEVHQCRYTWSSKANGDETDARAMPTFER